ncbi:Armadillo-type fold [Sesbania bispinosa]|nr:Armadillo-type fold [Sesbania bispinosa]
MDVDDPSKHRVLTLLNALRETCKDLHSKTNPFSFLLFKTDSMAAIDALLELEAKAVSIFSTDPNLRNLSHSLSTLRTLIENLHKCRGYGLRSLLRRQITSYQISQLACSVESQIQAYIDRVTVQDLVKTLVGPCGEDEKLKALVDFEERLSQGFDLDFQELVLRAKVFNVLERMLFEPLSSKRVQEEAAVAIAALVKFNKNVFVGLVLMGPTIKALIAMASSCSIQVLSSLVRFIRSPLVDEILSSGEIPTIIGFLWSRDLSLRVAALDCVLEIAYIGRREVVEAMLQQDLLEVGEGLSPEEKREVKLEILRMVKEASQSDAEFATVSAEVLWGAEP